MNAGSWRRLGTHRAMAQGTRVFGVPVGAGMNATLEMPFAHMRPHMSSKKQDDPTWSQVLGMQLAVLHHSADAARRAHFGAPCILDEPGVDMLVVP